MAPSLRPPIILDTVFLHYFGLYTLGALSRHVDLLVSLISYASQVVFFLQVSPFLMFFLSSIPIISWGWFWA